jgi:hypothetical protein
MFILLIFGGVQYSHADEPDTTNFACDSEMAMNEIAAALVKSQQDADNVAHDYLVKRTCRFTNTPITVVVAYRGMTYGEGDARIVVVGFKSADNIWLYGLMPYDDHAI